ATVRDPIVTNVQTYIWEKIYNIVFGEDSIDNWDSYVDQLYTLGIEDAIKVVQAAYDRYLER
ncbi:MAG: ABC transporter substrate-binding protein, partial [Clostridia bacterium]|nr:ABC transporter substrate-binding protein [Clostridia bacterium]